MMRGFLLLELGIVGEESLGLPFVFVDGLGRALVCLISSRDTVHHSNWTYVVSRIVLGVI